VSVSERKVRERPTCGGGGSRSFTPPKGWPTLCQTTVYGTDWRKCPGLVSTKGLWNDYAPQPRDNDVAPLGSPRCAFPHNKRPGTVHAYILAMTKFALPSLACLFAMTLAGQTRAEAGVAATCRAEVASGEAAVVPANALALPATRPSLSFDIETIEGNLTPAVSTIPAPWTMVPEPLTGAWLAKIPAGALVVGSKHSFTATAQCKNIQGTTPSSGFDFTVGPETALPAVAGSVSAASGGGIELTLSRELAAYAPLAQLTIYANGKFAARAPYGTLKDGARYDSSTLRYGACADTGPGASPVKATFELRFHVAGAEVDPPPITVTNIDVVCAIASPPSSPGPSSPADAGANEPATSAESSSGSCSTAPGPPDTTALTGCAMTLIALIALRRRRRAQAESVRTPKGSQTGIRWGN
jgi:MYXO-CTERM domain-containing protein